MSLTNKKKRQRLAQRRYRERLGKEEINRRARKWAHDNPEKRRKAEQNYRRRNRKKYNMRRLRQNKQKWLQVIAILGEKCFICGLNYKSKQKRRISFHEIHNKPHAENPYYILNHIEDFIPLCREHHTVFHAYLKYKEGFDKLYRGDIEKE